MKNRVLYFLRVLLVISTIITLFFINIAYSKYEDQYDTNYKLGINGWFIKINDIDIQEITTLNEVMEVIWIENEHINEGLFVPARQGYFEFNIDYTYVSVDFDIKIKIEQLNTNILEDFKIYGYTIDDGEIVELDYTGTPEESNILTIPVNIYETRPEVTENPEENEITTPEVTENPEMENEIATPEELRPTQKKKKTIRVFLEWNDDENNKMDNKQDTEYITKGEHIEGSEKTAFTYNLWVSFEQHVNI